MNSAASLPYELHTHGSGAFVIFNATDQVALPLLALARATLRETQERDEIALDFQSVEVVIEGRGLGDMMEHLLAGRVKRVSCANDGACEIARLRFTETQ